MSVRMEVDGLAELEAQLAELEHVAQKRVLRQATRASAKPIEQKMLERVDSAGLIDTGLMRASIKTRVSAPRKKQYADIVASVGVFKMNALMRQFGLDPKKAIPPTVYAWWLEHGTVDLPATPFIRPAFDSQLSQTLLIQRDTLRKAIDTALKRAAKS